MDIKALVQLGVINRYPGCAGAAGKKIRGAVRSGQILKSAFCECCGRSDLAIQAHHFDYNLPYSVIWLCEKCHWRVHFELHRLAGEPASIWELRTWTVDGQPYEKK